MPLFPAPWVSNPLVRSSPRGNGHSLGLGDLIHGRGEKASASRARKADDDRHRSQSPIITNKLDETRDLLRAGGGHPLSFGVPGKSRRRRAADPPPGLGWTGPAHNLAIDHFSFATDDLPAELAKLDRLGVKEFCTPIPMASAPRLFATTPTARASRSPPATRSPPPTPAPTPRWPPQRSASALPLRENGRAIRKRANI